MEALVLMIFLQDTIIVNTWISRSHPPGSAKTAKFGLLKDEFIVSLSHPTKVET